MTNEELIIRGFSGSCLCVNICRNSGKLCHIAHAATFSELVGAARFFGARVKLISKLQCRFVFCCCCNGKVKVRY